MFPTRRAGRALGSSADVRAQAVSGLSLAYPLAGTVLLGAWLITVLFSSTCSVAEDGLDVATPVLAGVAVALALFALCDRVGRREPEPRRRIVAAASWTVAALLALMCFAPPVPFVPIAYGALWLLSGMLTACPVRRAHHLFSALARRLTTAQLAVTMGSFVAAAGLLALMAAQMNATAVTVFVLAAAPTASLLFPQGRLVLDDAPATRDVSAGASARHLHLAPRAVLVELVVLGFTSGFHIVTGQVVYANLAPFSLTILFIMAAGLTCVAVTRRAPHRGPRVAFGLALAGCAVAYAPMLFLSGRPDDLAWEIIQDVLVFLSTFALSLAFPHIPDGERPGEALSLSSRAIATLFVFLALGWIVGSAVCHSGGPDGIAFRVCATGCIALLVVGILALQIEPEERPEAQVQVRNDADEAPATPTRAKRDGGASRVDAVARSYALSERERALLRLFAAGLSVQQAADRLGVSHNTVKSHMAHIYAKTGVHTRSELEELLAG